MSAFYLMKPDHSPLTLALAVSLPGLRGTRIITAVLFVAMVLGFMLPSSLSQAEVSQPSIFAVVVGYNRSDDSSAPTLQYADDDAIRNFELVQSLGARAVLLTQPDRATRELYPTVQTTLPSWDNLQAATKSIRDEIERAQAQGRKTILYFFYTGHGNVHRGEGYVQLTDHRLTRTMFQELIRHLRADTVHVIIDACKSYFLIFERGPGGQRWSTPGSFLPSAPGLSGQVGFFLSTSSAAESHEWEAFQGGIFSHEVRSALRGAADLNGDGLVTYEEAAAFVHTANQVVPNEKYRPRFFSRPPSGRSADQAVLADLRSGNGRRLVFDLPHPGHLFVESGLGIRLADLHPGHAAFKLLLPSSGKLYVRAAASTQEYVLPEQGPLVLSQLKPRPTTARSRGAEHEAFRKLFSQPFDLKALTSYRSHPPESEDDPAPSRRWSEVLRPALGISAAVLLGVGGTLSVLAANQRDQVQEVTSQVARQEINTRINQYNNGAMACYLVGGLGVVSYFLWQLWPKPRPHIVISPALPRGPGLSLSTRW